MSLIYLNFKYSSWPTNQIIELNFISGVILQLERILTTSETILLWNNFYFCGFLIFLNFFSPFFTGPKNKKYESQSEKCWKNNQNNDDCVITFVLFLSLICLDENFKFDHVIWSVLNFNSNTFIIEMVIIQLIYFVKIHFLILINSYSQFIW